MTHRIAEMGSDTLDTRMFAYLDGGISGELGVPEEMQNACYGTDVGCPVHVGQDVTFRFFLTLVNLPDGNFTLEVALQAATGAFFTCASIEFHVVRRENDKVLLSYNNNVVS